MYTKYTKADWEKNTIIKDSVHGYINVPKPIAREIIDTDIFQRLKNIEQTGMQVLYPSATHNRFTHSLGVYHLSKKAFRHFKSNVQTDYPDVYGAVKRKFREGGESIRSVEETWRRWELMFQLASLLHDSGHSPFSHTLEFVYDLVEKPETLSDKLIAKCSDQFGKDFYEQAGRNSQKFVGKPHERMSALFVATEETEGECPGAEVKGGFKNRIRRLLESYMDAYGIFNIYSKKKEIFNEDIEFMVRMIIGCSYELDHADNYAAKQFHEQTGDWEIELQIRNCIISMLNSKLDVDNLDYVVRDSKYSGYASNNIDLERLLSSFTIINAYEFASPIHLEKNNLFDASVNLDSFEGEFINAKVSGECMISSVRDNLNVRGNIITDTEDISPVAEKKIFRTKEEFSAVVTLTAENNVINIKPKKEGQKAYLNISGNLEGDFKGIILGDTCKEAKEDPKARRRIFFAYKQNCMSVLMSAIDGSNFESKWVYAHHTTTFKNNYLIVYLLERYAEYLVDCEVAAFLEAMDKFFQKHQSGEDILAASGGEGDAGSYAKIEKILETYFPEEDEGYDVLRECLAKKGLRDDAEFLYEFLDLYQILKRLGERPVVSKDEANKKKLDRITEQMRERFIDYGKNGKFYHRPLLELFRNEIYKHYKRLGALEIQYFSDIMAMFEPGDIQGHYFYRTDDQDLLAEYKKLYRQLSAGSNRDKYMEFQISYRHMITRTSMPCLWKSYPEFNFYFSDWTAAELKEVERLFRRTSTPWGNASGEKQLNYAILSDYVRLSENAESLWAELKNQYGLTRLVYVEQRIKTKSLARHETYLSNRERVVRMEDIRLYPDHQSNVEFFYIFYELADGCNKAEFTPNNFLQEVRKILDKDKRKSGEEQKDGEIIRMDENGNVIIRDNVHGDIVFPPLFKAIIDTKEFQRLRRIKQLAMAGQVFPGAVHTRFSHSIGTYYVMRRILSHFKEYFSELRYNTKIDEQEENAILAAALLHDLGHGPYSHVFERTELSLGCKSHEEWTVAIITNPQTEIYSVLESAGEGFAQKVAGYIKCEKEAKEKEALYVEKLDDNLNLKFIFASLVSGQIDADRMDYLLRDSKFSGMSYGQFDLEKVIEGLAVSLDHTGRYRVCIKEQYRSAVEGYFYARYQMYDNIYFHPYKMFSEELFCRILQEAQKCVLNGQISSSMIPVAVEGIFTQAEIIEEEYCKLDDSVVDGAIQTWAGCGVPELAFLCNAKLNRKSYERLEILNFERFMEETKEIFGEDVFKMHFLICLKKEIEMYNAQNPVYILKQNGVIMDLEKCSNLAKERLVENYVYYSKEMAKNVYGRKEDELEEFERKLEKNLVGSNMEIEKKFVFPANKKEEVEQVIREIGAEGVYTVEFDTEKLQTDIYYDTQDMELNKKDYTLRVRKKEGKIYFTCKRPIESKSNGLGGQLEREESEELVSTDDLGDNQKLIGRFLKGIPDSFNIVEELQEKIKVINRRTKVIIERRSGNNSMLSEKYEAAIDCVKYENIINGNEAAECQLEIELKSSYQNRINMKQLTDRIEQKLDCLEAVKKSKYQRALDLTKGV